LENLDIKIRQHWNILNKIGWCRLMPLDQKRSVGGSCKRWYTIGADSMNLRKFLNHVTNYYILTKDSEVG
jgi:hypothetical protein